MNSMTITYVLTVSRYVIVCGKNHVTAESAFVIERFHLQSLQILAVHVARNEKYQKETNLKQTNVSAHLWPQPTGRTSSCGRSAIMEHSPGLPANSFILPNFSPRIQDLSVQHFISRQLNCLCDFVKWPCKLLIVTL